MSELCVGLVPAARPYRPAAGFQLNKPLDNFK
jgi:hypothetical protein